MYIEISNHNPLSRLEVVEIAELKNIPCILVMNPAGQWEEQSYYEDIVGIKGDYLFSDSIRKQGLKSLPDRGICRLM